MQPKDQDRDRISEKRLKGGVLTPDSAIRAHREATLAGQQPVALPTGAAWFTLGKTGAAHSVCNDAHGPGVPMRHIGNIAEPQQAERFIRFLDAQHIEATIRQAQDTGYAVWVIEEDRVATARQELEAFLARPDDPRFDVPTAHPLRGARRVLRRSTPADRSRVIDVRTEIFQRRGWSTTPVTVFLIVVSVAVTLLANVPAL